MNLRHIWIVFKKELKDILRDKKTILSAVVAPLIIMPILFLLVGGGNEKMIKEQTENITVALTAQSDTESARRFITDNLAARNKNIIFVGAVNDPWQAINSKKAKLVVELDKDFEQKLKTNEPFTLKILYDDTLSSSGGSVGTLESAIADLNGAIAQERLKAQGIDPKILTPALVEKQNISRSEGGNPYLMIILPMLIAMLVAVGGIPAATDLVAGEKERMTFEPLLTTRSSRMSILVGKYLTINLFSFASVISTLAGMVLAYFIKPTSFTMGQGEIGGLNLDPVALILSLLITLLLGMTFSGIQLAISTYARSFKEGQTYLSLLIFIAIIPAYATMTVMPNDIQTYMFFIPIINTISAFKLILGGVINYTGLLYASVSSIIYVIISLRVAAWMFKQEKYMFRS